MKVKDLPSGSSCYAVSYDEHTIGMLRRDGDECFLFPSGNAPVPLDPEHDVTVLVPISGDTGLSAIVAERVKQLQEWSIAHDAGEHGSIGLVDQAMHVLDPKNHGPRASMGWDVMDQNWDWNRRLAAAGALIAAAIDVRLAIKEDSHV